MTPTPSGESPKDERATQAEPAGEREAAEPNQSSTVEERDCPHCSYTGTAHCGDVADKIAAMGGQPADCSNAKVYGMRAAPSDLVHRLRVAASEWLPTSDHTLRAHKLLEEAADALAAQPAAQGMARAALSTSSTKPGEAEEPSRWTQYVAGMIVAYLGGDVDDARIKPIAGIIERRLWALAAPEAPAIPAWVWNPASEEWERVHVPGRWMQGAIYTFSDTQPEAPASTSSASLADGAEPRQDLGVPAQAPSRDPLKPSGHAAIPNA